MSRRFEMEFHRKLQNVLSLDLEYDVFKEKCIF